MVAHAPQVVYLVLSTTFAAQVIAALYPCMSIDKYCAVLAQLDIDLMIKIMACLGVQVRNYRS